MLPDPGRGELPTDWRGVNDRCLCEGVGKYGLTKSSDIVFDYPNEFSWKFSNWVCAEDASIVPCIIRRVLCIQSFDLVCIHSLGMLTAMRSRSRSLSTMYKAF